MTHSSSSGNIKCVSNCFEKKSRTSHGITLHLHTFVNKKQHKTEKSKHKMRQNEAL